MKKLIDISYYQKPEDIDYAILLSQVDGVIIRSGYGTGVDWKGWGNSPDPAFDRHYAEVKKAGLPVGAYHYLVEFETVDAQIGIIKRALDGKQLDHIKVWDGEKYVEQLLFFADIEYEQNAPKITRKTVIEFITKLEAYFGEPIGIYTGAWTWNPIMGTDNPFSDRFLWVSGYPNAAIPYGWTDYWIHQHTSSGHLEGYDGNLDMNKVEDNKWIPVSEPIPNTIEPLDVPLFSQKDARWASDKLGTSSVTIGAYGCLITAASMVAKYFGKDTDPGRINKSLIEVDGYDSQNLLRHSAITTIYPDIIVNWSYFLADPSDALIDEVLIQELPVIVQVDYRPDTSALDQHWVIVVGKDSNGYIIADPIDGQTAYLSRYAGKAYRMVVYEYQQAEEPLFKVKILAGALNVRSTPAYIADGSNIVDLLKKDDVVNVYEINESNGWLRIGVSKWISGSTQYVEKIEIEEPPEPPLTIEERLDAIEKRLDIIEEELG